MMALAAQAEPRDKSADSLPEKASKGTCAVLTFDVKGGISLEECALLTDRFMVEFDKIGQFTLLPRSKMSEVLKLQEFSRSENCSATECAVEAGKLLSVQYMVYGSIGKFGGMYTLNTFMVNVESGATEKRATTDHEGRLEDLLKLAMRQNAQQLLGLSEETETRPPVTVAAQPVPSRVVDVKPARPVAAEDPEDHPGPGKAPQPLPEDLKNGLVLHYTFDTNEGDKVTDGSSKNNQGEVHGAKWTANGQVGGAYKFNGKGDYIDTKASFSGLNEITVSGWTYLSDVPPDTSIITQYGDYKSDNVWALFSGANGKGSEINVCDANGTDHNFYGNAYELKKWKHLCFTYFRGKTLKLYENGILVKSVAVPDLPLCASTRCTAKVGASQGLSCYWGAGLIDEVMIYDRALTGNEVKLIWDLQASDDMKAEADGEIMVNGVLKPFPSNLRKGLILYYPFDKDEGRRVTDWSGKRNNAAVKGADFFKDGVRGGVYKFNGVSSVIEGSHENSLPIGGASKTVSVWVKPLTVGGIILKHGNDAHISSQGFSFNINAKFTIWLAGYNINVVSTGAMTPDAWNHLCVTYESSRASIYINGVLDTAGNFSQNIPAGTNFEIGHNTLAGSNNYFEGWLDDVMVYDRALSGEEVKQLYTFQVAEGVRVTQNKGPADLKNGLILHYSFDRDESGRITDMSGNGNGATARGAKWTPNGKVGGAYEFDGVDDIIDGTKDNTLPVGDASKSMAVWVKPAATGGLFLKHGSNAHDTAQGFSFLTHGDGTIWLAGYNTDLSSKGVLTPDVWNHVCVTYESSRACIYINGVLDATGTFSQNIPAGTNLEIGHNTLNGDNNRYKGTIDEVRIYNRVLTEGEVKRIYGLQK